MRTGYARAMDVLYVLCIGLAGVSLVLITLIIPWGVYTRYVLGTGSAWPEPMSILLMIVFTFAGAAAVYRANAHIAVTLFTSRLPPRPALWLGRAVEMLMAVLGIFMVVWGLQLVQTTWNQVIAEFPFLSVGLTYLPLPVGGAVMLLFILERVCIGAPGPGSFVHRQPSETD